MCGTGNDAAASERAAEDGSSVGHLVAVIYSADDKRAMMVA